MKIFSLGLGALAALAHFEHGPLSGSIFRKARVIDDGHEHVHEHVNEHDHALTLKPDP
ncbi:MAG: hypothetical protein ACR2L2_20220 [Acidobacteriota bacterium]